MVMHENELNKKKIKFQPAGIKLNHNIFFQALLSGIYPYGISNPQYD